MVILDFGSGYFTNDMEHKKAMVNKGKTDWIKLYIDAWWCRTLSMVDFDHDDKWYPRMSEKTWKFGVKRDFKKLLKKLNGKE